MCLRFKPIKNAPRVYRDRMMKYNTAVRSASELPFLYIYIFLGTTQNDSISFLFIIWHTE